MKSEHLLSETEMELPSAALAGHRVEAVTDVESQHTEHRHEHPYTCTGRTVEFERVIRFYPGIRITAFCEHEGVNARRLSQSYRITQFHREFVVYRVSFAQCGCTGSYGVVLVTSERYYLAAVITVLRHTAASHLEALERPKPDIVIVHSKIAKFRVGHKH